MIDNKIKAFVSELKETEYPLTALAKVREQLKNETIYNDILELTIVLLLTENK